MDWEYQGKSGPENWKILCTEFAEAENNVLQSPISLSTQAGIVGDKQTKLAICYINTLFESSFFNHTVHLKPLTNIAKNKLSFKGKNFFLEDVHVHLPSEHQIDGEFYTMEIHLVHYSSQREPVVLAVMIEANEKEEDFIHFDLKKVQNQKKITIKLARILPQLQNFFYYTGSLTTPPTVGPVKWIIFKDPISLNQRFLTEIKKQVGKTNRPLQPLSGRDVYFYPTN